jgi:hypothetical protein
LGLQIGQPTVIKLLGGLGESHLAEWQKDHADLVFASARHEGSADTVQ